jgi:hypothetical protein
MAQGTCRGLPASQHAGETLCIINQGEGPIRDPAARVSLLNESEESLVNPRRIKDQKTQCSEIALGNTEANC